MMGAMVMMMRYGARQCRPTDDDNGPPTRMIRMIHPSRNSIIMSKNNSEYDGLVIIMSKTIIIAIVFDMMITKP